MKILNQILKFIKKNKLIVILFIVLILLSFLVKRETEGFDNIELNTCEEGCKIPSKLTTEYKKYCIEVDNNGIKEYICLKKNKDSIRGCLGCKPYVVYDNDGNIKQTLESGISKEALNENIQQLLERLEYEEQEKEQERLKQEEDLVKQKNIIDKAMENNSKDTKLTKDSDDIKLNKDAGDIDKINNLVKPKNTSDNNSTDETTNINIALGRVGNPYNVPTIEQQTITTIKRYDPIHIDKQGPFDIYNKNSTFDINNNPYMNRIPQPYMSSLNV
jgi:hypothetical protein